MARAVPLLAVIAAAAPALAARHPDGSAEAGGRVVTRPRTTAGPDRPTKVVIIVVDSLSKEIVDKYDMRNVEALMRDGVDTPRGYLGHTGSVTVVTHNVITSGQLPKHMGWTDEGYRDVDGDPRRPRADQPRPALHHQQRDHRPVQAAAGRRLPQAGRLPRGRRPDGQDLHDQPQGVRRRTRSAARGRTRSSPSAAAPSARRRARGASRPASTSPSYILGDAVQPVLGAQRLPDLRLRHRQAAGDPLPARQRPLRHRPGPGPRRRRRVGRGRGRRGHAQRAELERHLRDAARASTRRRTCGAASTTPARPAPTATR